MNELIEILEDIKPGVDYENCETLIDDNIFQSLDIISLIAELEDEYDITIPTVEIVPDNFNSAEKIMNLVNKLIEEDQ